MSLAIFIQTYMARKNDIFQCSHYVNPYPAEFLKLKNPPFIFWNSPFFRELKVGQLSHWYRAWSDCTDAQAVLAQYWR